MNIIFRVVPIAVLVAIAGLVLIMVPHEFGHYIVGRLFKMELVRIDMLFCYYDKETKKFAKLKKNKRIAVCLKTSRDVTRREYIAMLSAGAGFNFLTALILFLIPNFFATIFAWECLFNGVVNLLPFYPDFWSDGSRIYRLMKKDSGNAEVAFYRIERDLVDGIVKYNYLDELENYQGKSKFYEYAALWVRSLLKETSDEEYQELRKKQSKLIFSRGCEGLGIPISRD